jgi:hypothetical protein
MNSFGQIEDNHQLRKVKFDFWFFCFLNKINFF